MNIGGLAMQAFGGAVKELDGKGKEDVRAVFRQVWFSRGPIWTEWSVALRRFRLPKPILRENLKKTVL